MLYAYTLNYKTGRITERTGEFERWILHSGKTWMFREVIDGKPTRKYLTSLSRCEGTVRGSTIWFFEPNMEGALNAFKEKSREMGKDYFNKSVNAYTRNIVTE